METGNTKNLISEDFFPEGLQLDIGRIFPMAVIATMSSGKSTLINALLGKEIMPNSNMACTALNYSILDDDRDTKEIICVTTKDGKTEVLEENLSEELIRINQSEQVTDVFIRSHVKGVINTDRALLMIDTPGPNNARNASHAETLNEILDKLRGGLLLYVMNASQMGIRDDKNLLLSLKKRMEDNPKLRILFAVNKMDMLDDAYESVDEFMLTVKAYLTDCGFEHANIIPVSARAALLLKKALAGEELTRLEWRDFEALYDLYAPKDFNMKRYAVTEELPNQQDELEVKGTKYKIGALNQAIDNTGIRLLEEQLQKAQILSSGRIRNKVKVKIEKQEKRQEQKPLPVPDFLK